MITVLPVAYYCSLQIFFSDTRKRTSKWIFLYFRYLIQNNDAIEAKTDRRSYLCRWVTLHPIVLHYNLRKLEHWPKLSLCSYKSIHIFQSVPRRLTFQYFIACKVLDKGLNVHKAMLYWDKVEDDHFTCDVNFHRPGLQSPPYPFDA